MRRLVAILAIAMAFGTLADAQEARPTISVCLKARSQLSSVPRSVYSVTIDWNGYNWSPGERIDIGIWDAQNEVWPQLRDNRFRPGREVTTQDIVVQDDSVYPLYFSLIKLSENLSRLSNSECQRGFCSIPNDIEGLEEVTNRDARWPVLTAGGGQPC
jgi:hypothetical protein